MDAATGFSIFGSIVITILGRKYQTPASTTTAIVILIVFIIFLSPVCCCLRGFTARIRAAKIFGDESADDEGGRLTRRGRGTDKGGLNPPI
jgi:hypothetical protein